MRSKLAVVAVKPWSSVLSFREVFGLVIVSGISDLCALAKEREVETDNCFEFLELEELDIN